MYHLYAQLPIIAFFLDFCKERIFKILSKMSKFSLWLRKLERFFWERISRFGEILKIWSQTSRFSCFSIPNGLQGQNILISTAYFNVVNANLRSRHSKIRTNMMEILPHYSKAHPKNQNYTSDDSKRWKNPATCKILVLELKNNDLCSVMNNLKILSWNLSGEKYFRNL